MYGAAVRSDANRGLVRQDRDRGADQEFEVASQLLIREDSSVCLAWMD